MAAFETFEATNEAIEKNPFYVPTWDEDECVAEWCSQWCDVMAKEMDEQPHSWSFFMCRVKTCLNQGVTTHSHPGPGTCGRYWSKYWGGVLVLGGSTEYWYYSMVRLS